MTGSGTILADNPHFTVRHVDDVPGKVRPLVILDRRGRVPSEYMRQAQARGFAPTTSGDLQAALTHLGQRGCMEVLVEAGPELAAACRALKLVDLDITIERLADTDRISAIYADPSLNSLHPKGEADVFGNN